MALSPSIPTSFVPKQPVTPGKKHYSAGNNIFSVVAFLILALALAASAGVYLYSKYLVSVEATKAAQVTQAQNQVSASTVEQFVRLRDRLSASKGLITQHVELSQFFTLLESITLQDVDYTTLGITVATDGSAAITMVGTAKDFNSLAAESTAFAQEPNVQSAIFSGISVNPTTGLVNFTLNATLAPGLVIEAAPPTTPAILQEANVALPTSTSTPAFAPAPSASSTTAQAATGPSAAASSTTP